MIQFDLSEWEMLHPSRQVLKSLIHETLRSLDVNRGRELAFLPWQVFLRLGLQGLQTILPSNRILNPNTGLLSVSLCIFFDLFGIFFGFFKLEVSFIGCLIHDSIE